MAEVKHSLVRGAYKLTHKTFNNHLLKSLNKQGKSAIQASSLSTGILLSDIQNGELYGTENAADRVTVGVSPDSYTRVTPLSIAEYEYNLELNKKCSSPMKPRDQTELRNFFRCGRYANRGTISTFRSTPGLQSLGNRVLLCGHGQLVFVRHYSGDESRSEPLFKTKTGYYDILGVTPTATQAQVKTAYYKQSFLYHPDRNAGSDEANDRFSEINEAYTVLGNKALRRKYDRGLLSQSDLVATTRPSGKDATGSSGKRQAGSRRSVMDVDGQGGVFDFDKFFKAHYSEQLQKEKDIRSRKEELKAGTKGTSWVMELGFGLMMMMAVALIYSLKHNWRMCQREILSLFENFEHLNRHVLRDTWIITSIHTT